MTSQMKIAVGAAAFALLSGVAHAQRTPISPSMSPVTVLTPWSVTSSDFPKAAAAVQTVSFGEINFELVPIVSDKSDYRTFRPGDAVHSVGSLTAACAPGFGSEWSAWREKSSGLPTGQRMHKPFVFTKALDDSTPGLWARRITANIAPVDVKRVDDGKTCVETVYFAVASMYIEAANADSPSKFDGSLNNLAVEIEACPGCGTATPDYGFRLVAGGGTSRVKSALTYGSEDDYAVPSVDEYETSEPLWLRGVATADRKDLLGWVSEALAGKGTARGIRVSELRAGGRGQVRTGRTSEFSGAYVKRYYIPPFRIGAVNEDCGACVELEYLEVQPTRSGRDAQSGLR